MRERGSKGRNNKDRDNPDRRVRAKETRQTSFQIRWEKEKWRLLASPDTVRLIIAENLSRSLFGPDREELGRGLEESVWLNLLGPLTWPYIVPLQVLHDYEPLCSKLRSMISRESQ